MNRRTLLLWLALWTWAAATPDWTRLAIQGVRLGQPPQTVRKLHGAPLEASEPMGELYNWDYPAGKPFMIGFDKAGVMTVWGHQLESRDDLLLKAGASARTVRKVLGEPDYVKKVLGMDAIWFYYRKVTLRVTWEITGVKAFCLEKPEYTMRYPSDTK